MGRDQRLVPAESLSAGGQGAPGATRPSTSQPMGSR